jgi:Arc/MetJ family transcription regulator
MPSAEMIATLTEMANKLVWKKPNLNVLRPEYEDHYSPIARSIEKHIKSSASRGRLVLPELRAFGNQTVAIFSDYGGEHKSAKYLTYSALVCGWQLIEPFLQQMKKIRMRHSLGQKEISFKDLRMGQLQRALPSYLTALDLVPGFFFSLAVDKSLHSLFGTKGKATDDFIAQTLKEAGLGERKAAINEKLLRIVHVLAFLTGLLAHDGQKIFWMTDDDAISPTKEMHVKTMALFQRILAMYARPNYKFPLFGAALPFEARDLTTLDLLSATDIVAGSIEQILTGKRVKPSVARILQWLAHDGIGLKKMNMIMRPGGGHVIDVTTLEFHLENPPPDPIMIPVYGG